MVVDEAYIDFADTQSMVRYIGQIPNLVVMQTLSKAMGAAGIRLGIGFMDVDLVAVLNKIKPPYNINEASQKIALSIVQNRQQKMVQVSEILNERIKVTDQISHYKFVKKYFRQKQILYSSGWMMQIICIVICYPKESWLVIETNNSGAKVVSVLP